MSARVHAALRVILALGLALAVLGCINIPGGVAPSTTPIEGRSYQVLGETSATDSSIWILGLIPISGSNRTDQAISKAIKKKDADALINVAVDGYTQFWILFTRHVTKVRATAIRFDE